MRIFLGLAFLIAGPIMTIKYESMYKFFGEVGFAEKYLGTGSSRFFYQLFGAFIAIVGMMIIFNIHKGILLWIFGPLFSR